MLKNLWLVIFLIFTGIGDAQATTILEILNANTSVRIGHLGAPYSGSCKAEVTPPPTAAGNYFGVHVRSPVEGNNYLFNGAFWFPQSSNDWTLDLVNSKLLYQFPIGGSSVEFSYNPMTLRFTKFSHVYWQCILD